MRTRFGYVRASGAPRLIPFRASAAAPGERPSASHVARFPTERWSARTRATAGGTSGTARTARLRSASSRIEAAPEIVSTSVPAATEPPKPTSLYADALADAPESEAASEPEEPREIEPSGSPSASAIADAEVSAAEEERDS